MKYRPGYLLLLGGFWMIGIYIMTNFSSKVGIFYSIVGLMLMIVHVLYLNAQKAIFYQFFLYSMPVSLVILCVLYYSSPLHKLRELVGEHKWLWYWATISLPLSALLYPKDR